MSNLNFLTRCDKPERQQPCIEPANPLEAFGGIIRQGVDCRAHVGTGGTTSPDFDWIRDENLMTPGLGSNLVIGTPRFWTKIGKKVRVRLELSATVLDELFASPTEPIYMFIGFLPFRRTPFDQPPPSVGGDVH